MCSDTKQKQNMLYTILHYIKSEMELSFIHQGRIFIILFHMVQHVIHTDFEENIQFVRLKMLPNNQDVIKNCCSSSIVSRLKRTYWC